MSELMKVLVPGLAIVVVAGVLGYVYLQNKRGSLTLQLPSTVLPGGTVSGSVELLVKQSVEKGRLVVGLIGEEITVTDRGDREYEGTREFFRQELSLEGPRSFLSGEPVGRPFSFELPSEDQWEITVDLTEVEWRIEARFETRGIDLFARQVLNVRSQGDR